ncbi:hypothetical protein ACS7SF_27395 (plasmid) [Ralstonia sp. 25C]|uniref:hypothetical protein n=1 Tax=Ralstonia sp. 25C TaxID=3447363 RepID=UPI003F75197B
MSFSSAHRQETDVPLAAASILTADKPNNGITVDSLNRRFVGLTLALTNCRTTKTTDVRSID